MPLSHLLGKGGIDTMAVRECGALPLLRRELIVKAGNLVEWNTRQEQLDTIETEVLRHSGSSLSLRRGGKGVEQTMWKLTVW